MREEDYYAPGSYKDPRAPWNEVVYPEEEVDVTVSQTLSATFKCYTNDYEMESEEDEEGHYRTYPSFSQQNLEDAMNTNGFLTPIELLEKFKEGIKGDLAELEAEINVEHTDAVLMGLKRQKRYCEDLIANIEAYTVDETDFEEE